ncbi:hypothetical protein OB955_25140 [Halobacteria archaeon AArc-m2/3/4]|uniref:Uncharacterized protein n=1 Tax=Natronoglomus mannanivorans TaxID=2979990 RepID=A0AAP3E4H9_9EURY|nr:hypothetical protein [Halobacteria archaeon AArc-xg1-1]MCU4975963.1 hypothetical protein [Halobacteria archaeon AArc-m2/3/4]
MNVAEKSGWAAGTFAALFISEILGLEYDDADRTLRFEPLGYTGDFRWTDARFGRCSLEIEFVDGEDGTVLSVANRNSFPLTVQGDLPVERIPDVIEVNGDETRDFEHESHFDRSMIHVSAPLEPGERLALVV